MKIYRPVMFEFCEKCKKLRRIRIKCKLNNVLVKRSGFLPSYDIAIGVPALYATCEVCGHEFMTPELMEISRGFAVRKAQRGWRR